MEYRTQCCFGYFKTDLYIFSVSFYQRVLALNCVAFLIIKPSFILLLVSALYIEAAILSL